MLKGKSVLITGASSGVGREISLLFASEGPKVVAVARSKGKLEELSEEASNLPGEISPFEADITKDKNINFIVDFIMDKYNKIDILVNNVGIMDDFSPVGDLEDEQFHKILDVNFISPMKLTRKVIPIMLNQDEGNIINMASLGGLHGGRAGAAYTSSKFAVVGLTKNTAYMYAEEGIRCNAICPGGIDTDISKGIEPNEFGINRIMKGTGNNIRSGSPKEIADIALFLASDKSSFINGDTIVADAGWTAH